MSLFTALALLAAAPAAGEDPNSIIVTGTPDAKREERKRAAEFVRRTGVATLNPVARWIAPVCPRTIGVDAKVAGIVDDRIRRHGNEARCEVVPIPSRTLERAAHERHDGEARHRRVGDAATIRTARWASRPCRRSCPRPCPP